MLNNIYVKNGSGTKVCSWENPGRGGAVNDGFPR
jgi:hypothetical protein